LRKTFRATSIDQVENDEQKISATFTISPPPRAAVTNSISQLTSRLEKGLDLEGSNSVTATINVPLIPPIRTTTTTTITSSDKLSKKTEQSSPPIPQPRSLFDIDNATSAKLADKLQLEAKKCDLTTMSEDSSETSPSGSEPLSHLTEPLPPSPIHHTIFGERRPSWRLKTDFNNKVITHTNTTLSMDLYVVLSFCLCKYICFLQIGTFTFHFQWIHIKTTKTPLSFSSLPAVMILNFLILYLRSIFGF
jgi:hypothetical protein